MNEKPLMIIEDNDVDYELIVRGLGRAGLKSSVVHCRTGDEAIDYLHGCVESDEQAMILEPRVILLDLNMPGMDGRDVLTSIASNRKLLHIPVVVMTPSSAEEDIEECYALGARSFLTKPGDSKEFLQILAEFKRFWFDVTQLPGDRRRAA